jgi:hypothetical protein
MLATDPLTKTYVFQFDIVTKQLAANFFLVGFGAILVVLRFVARQVRKTAVWYVATDALVATMQILTNCRWDDFAAVASLVFTVGMYKALDIPHELCDATSYL